MTTKHYERFKSKYETTKPIRGRVEEVRPIGGRRRTWECLTKEDRPDGEWYGAMLYNTNVVMYGPNGEIELSSGGWNTPSTAEFMTLHSPFTVTKNNRKLWVYCNKETHLLPKDTPLKIKPVVTKLVGSEDGSKIQGFHYEVENIQTMRQRVVNRTASNAIRKRIKPFIDFSTTMLKLSDGWLMNATIEPYEIVEGATWHPLYDFGFGNDMDPKGSSNYPNRVLVVLRGAMPNTDREVYSWITEQAVKDWDDAIEQVITMLEQGDTELWQRAMYQMLISIDPIEERLVRTQKVDIPVGHGGVHQITRKYFDSQYKVNQLTHRINKIITAHSSTRGERMVEGNKVRKGLLG